MLLRYFGRKNLKNYMRTLGGTVVKDNKNVSCPKDMAIYLKNIYDFCNNNGELGEELKYNLCNTMFNDRLPKLLPKDVEVAHKVGDQIQAVHDVGIIYADKPYVLTIMSKGVVSDEEAHNVIAQISKKVYDYVKDR
jgi:beta-lactamase class A